MLLYEEREHPSIIRNMNRISFRAIITTIAAVSLFAACEKYDDSALVARMDKAEADIKELQTLLNQLNSTLSGLATTVDALKAQDRIVSVTELADKSGWVVEFSQTGKITIYNGKNGIDGKDGKDGTNGTDGTNGQDGITPTIGVKLDADGNYYWTIQSEGNELGISVQGDDNKINLAQRALGSAEAYQFFIAKSYNDFRPLQGKIAEARVWSVARTPEEIWENMYRIKNPKDLPELIGYWKFDEGKGNTVKDYSMYGNDGVAEKDIVWPSGIEIPEINKEEE